MLFSWTRPDWGNEDRRLARAAGGDGSKGRRGVPVVGNAMAVRDTAGCNPQRERPGSTWRRELLLCAHAPAPKRVNIDSAGGVTPGNGPAPLARARLAQLHQCSVASFRLGTNIRQRSIAAVLLAPLCSPTLWKEVRRCKDTTVLAELRPMHIYRHTIHRYT